MLVNIDILDWSSVSPLGSEPCEIWESYLSPAHALVNTGDWVSPLQPKEDNRITALRNEHNKYRSLDRSTLIAIFSGRKLRKHNINNSCGLSIGSSRGATTQFEAFYDDFLAHGSTSPLASPTTTLGNLSSWVAQDLGLQGFSMSHSITCSTALHSIANACAWLKAGFATQFIAGASEAPLTPFTIAQMKAMRIYAENTVLEYPCKAYDLNKTQNTMVLGEGAALFLLGKDQVKPAARIISVGYATEPITHGSSISADGESLQHAMQMALHGLEKDSIDAVVMHSPGTIKGDEAERKAIEKIFGEKTPLLTNNKWKVGHTLGASGALSMDFALLMLRHQCFIGLPWEKDPVKQRPLNKILINAVGFGGNAVSVVVGL